MTERKIASEGTDRAAISDSISVELNGESLTEPAVRGPDPDEWGDDARAERGAVTEIAAPVEPEAVKGPGPQWSDEARAARGAFQAPAGTDDED